MKDDKAREFIDKWMASIDLKKYMYDAFMEWHHKNQMKELFLYRFDHKITDEEFAQIREKSNPVQYKLLNK